MSPVFGNWRRARLARALERYEPETGRFPHDAHGKLACEVALAAAAEGNYGVGAILVDEAGETLLTAGNQAFVPRFASEGHAEMALVSRLEAERPELPPGELTLVVSLEPCPMCYARLKLAGIGRVLYLAADEGGGMVRRAEHLPPAWTTLHPWQEFATAEVGPRLRHLARAIFRHNLTAMRYRLVARSRPA